MKQLRTWWRGVGGLLLPCLLALMVLSPTIDAAVCFGDSGVASAPVAEAAAVAKPDSKPVDRHDGGDVCPHGHCHHSAPMLIAQLDGEPARPLRQTLHPTLNASAAPSLAPAGPERPPRA